jgi:D-beta-D-heptose 7-phosphate kinase/D-beta-D-heptose 1-phosphate adenosyltransferase
MMEHYQNKIVWTVEEALKVLDKWKSVESTVVFTNGCFDLLHSGHLQYLHEAKNLGTKLIIGVNDDDSVRRLKGENRPILELAERLEMLSSLQMVDLVVPFGEDTPEKLIKAIQPDILVKGGDYSIEEIVGADFVLQNGGKVESLSFKPGISTSGIIQRIIKNHK